MIAVLQGLISSKVQLVQGVRQGCVTDLELAKICQQSHVSVTGCNRPQVLEYHFKFHNPHMVEMQEGHYSGWEHVDSGLMSIHLYGHPKTHPIKPNAPLAWKSTKDMSKQICIPIFQMCHTLQDRPNSQMCHDPFPMLSPIHSPSPYLHWAYSTDPF